MLGGISKVDNFLVMLKKSVDWIVFETSSSSKTVFLNDLLKKRFPKSKFHFHPFYESKIAKKLLAAKPAGVILELKTFSQASLKVFDRFIKDFSEIPQIFILCPSGFQLLNQKRKEKLQHAMIAISETTSLDYLIQLPRMIEETGRKRLLRYQNERLQRLLQHRGMSQGFAPHPVTEIIENGKAISEILNSDCLETRSTQCGLKIRLKNWNRFSQSMGEIARNEVIELVSRMINRSVRNSDRVLRSKEDEFTIFLAHADSSNLSRCKERIAKTLSELQISANRKSYSLPFLISSIDQLTLV